MNLIALRSWTFCLGLLSCFFSSGVRADDAAVPAGYHLIWADEFSKDPDGLPDPAKWSYEVGYVRNHEAQCYTQARLENARIEHGQLIIEARKETPPYPIVNDGDTSIAKVPYTSAALETVRKADWLYGRIEVRAKLPAGKGVWPAIWMLGANEKQVGWPKCGEIDIMELVGKEPGIIHGTLHYFADGKHTQSGDKLPIDHPENDFHVYAAEWNRDHIDLFVDDQKYFSFDVRKADNDSQNPFRKPQYLILNLALGGSWGGPLDDTILPQRMTVDYVRVYQKD
jgi:beta-glucanase (GH16 family)